MTTTQTQSEPTPIASNGVLPKTEYKGTFAGGPQHYLKDAPFINIFKGKNQSACINLSGAQCHIYDTKKVNRANSKKDWGVSEFVWYRAKTRHGKTFFVNMATGEVRKRSDFDLILQKSHFTVMLDEW